MINLFNVPDFFVNTSKLENLLHGPVVKEFEQSFCEYVGAKYACSVNSATSAIFLCLLQKELTVKIPSIIPPVVLNSIINSGNWLEFEDNVDWVGGSYVLHDFGTYKIIDSAQRVDKDQFKNEANDSDLMIFSFYPTKPVGSCDGGIIVSNDKDKIDYLQEASMNGMTSSANNWERTVKFPGWKMYMNTIQAAMALNNLKQLNYKKLKIAVIRDFYNKHLGLNNTSDHLYRISVKDNVRFLDFAKKNGFVCGKHYAATHLLEVYRPHQKAYRISQYGVDTNINEMPLSEETDKTTASIPMHETMNIADASYIVEKIHEYNQLT